MNLPFIYNMLYVNVHSNHIGTIRHLLSPGSNQAVDETPGITERPLTGNGPSPYAAKSRKNFQYHPPFL
jgi:hypothetical protein